MRTIKLWAVIVFYLALAPPLHAQFTQGINDLGAADTVDMVYSVLPDAESGQLKVQMDLYVFNDSNIIGGATVGFDWDNPNLVMDSAVVSPMIATSLDFMNILYRGDHVDSTNKYQQFIFAGVYMFGPGVSTGPTRRLWASYYFTLTNWNVGDSIVVDTARYSQGTNFKFAIAGYSAGEGRNYTPFWTGKQIAYNTPCCIGLNGNIDYSNNPEPDIGDVSDLIRFLFIAESEAVLLCRSQADLDFNGDLDIGDLIILLDRLFVTLEPFDPCP